MTEKLLTGTLSLNTTNQPTLLGDLWLTVNAISAWRGGRDDICHLHEQIQLKQVFCFQSLFALFSQDLFSDYLGPTCGKNAWLLYIFFGDVRFRQPIP